MLPPFPSVPSSFWQTRHVNEQLRKVQDTIDLLKAVWAELDAISLIKESGCPCVKGVITSLSSLKEEGLLSFGDALECSKHDQSLLHKIVKVTEAKEIDINVQESLSLETANSLIPTLTSQLSPFNSVACQTSSWEGMSMAVKLANKIQKSKRDKRWKKKKRKRVAEKLRKKREMYDQVDQAADEWRAREIAKDIAKRKQRALLVINEDTNINSSTWPAANYTCQANFIPIYSRGNYKSKPFMDRWSFVKITCNSHKYTTYKRGYLHPHACSGQHSRVLVKRKGWRQNHGPVKHSTSLSGYHSRM